ncbi:hypothetical protein B0H67DRAFT_352204 [Lasiosphaeris hirsuta]|uniref:Secreted protein n=1 Tax=Lasiosphaeris hirsuta TaxID=260670 RepID=A0AA39ZVZ0_9PEZI|nr:hypothetical protein B0H67DRAFT_352204 [Lasiosphaeris hirsuta]
MPGLKGPCVPVANAIVTQNLVRDMLVRSILLSLLVALPALGSEIPPSCGNGSDDDPTSSQKSLKSQPECPPVNAQPIQCPDDRPCDNWCQHRTGVNCFKAGNPLNDTFAILSSVFGFQAPVNVRLCPVGKCEEHCLCREVLLKRLTALLLDDRHHDSEKDEKDEL